MKRSPSLVILVSLALVACGGGGSGNGTSTTGGGANTEYGTGTVNVVWPARSRVVPAAANSLVVKLTLGGSVVAQQLIVRPTSGATFTNLPVGSLGVSVAAYPNADGSGQAQGTGSGTMTTAVDVPGTATVSLASTVASLGISPGSPRLGKGVSATLTASAQDAAGNIVLLAAGGGSESIAWTSDSPAVVTVSGTGPTATIQCLTAGTSTIHASFVKNDAGATVSTSTGLTVVAGSGTVTVQ